MSEQQTDTVAPTRPPAVAPGNVAVITGGASGIGLAVAEAMIGEGMSVVLADIDAPKLRDVEARLSEDGASVATVVCNTTVEAEVDALVEYALEQFGGVHVMFNNAGIAGVGDAWSDPVDLWKRVLDVNVLGVVYGIRAVLPVMQEQGIGHIVSTASHAGLNGAPGIAPYVASKHAVVGLSESLFLELQLLGLAGRRQRAVPGVRQDRPDGQGTRRRRVADGAVHQPGARGGSSGWDPRERGGCGRRRGDQGRSVLDPHPRLDPPGVGGARPARC
jgi:NADP-dependent 3-hydroxy acid dehydrogenase YdfG